jgi:hypothetical protein
MKTKPVAEAMVLAVSFVLPKGASAQDWTNDCALVHPDPDSPICAASG